MHRAHALIGAALALGVSAPSPALVSDATNPRRTTPMPPRFDGFGRPVTNAPDPEPAMPSKSKKSKPVPYTMPERARLVAMGLPRNLPRRLARAALGLRRPLRGDERALLWKVQNRAAA